MRRFSRAWEAPRARGFHVKRILDHSLFLRSPGCGDARLYSLPICFFFRVRLMGFLFIGFYPHVFVVSCRCTGCKYVASLGGYGLLFQVLRSLTGGRRFLLEMARLTLVRPLLRNRSELVACVNEGSGLLGPCLEDYGVISEPTGRSQSQGSPRMGILNLLLRDLSFQDHKLGNRMLPPRSHGSPENFHTSA